MKQAETLKPRSQWYDVWLRLRKNRLAMVGMVIVCAFVLLAIFADVIAPYDYFEENFTDRLQYPSAAHWLGTDQYGRDLLSRIIYGGRISLLVSLLACIISMGAGCVFGAVSGYFGGFVESAIMRAADVLMSIPGMLLAVCISSSLGTGVWQTAVAASISGIPPATRMLRASLSTAGPRVQMIFVFLIKRSSI